MYKLLLHLFINIEIIIISFTLFSGLISDKFAKFNIYVLIPTIYILYILPYSITVLCKEYLAQKCIDNYPEDNNKSINDVINENSNEYILSNIHKKISNQYSYFNPISNQGLLGLSYILNIYILYYIWKDI